MRRSGLALSLTFAFGAVAGGLASTAAAQNACDGFGTTTFAPAHPVATDLIGVQVRSWLNPPAATTTTTTLSTISVVAGDSIYIDVIVTPYPEKYRGYRTIRAPYDDDYGLIGPLPVGDHPLHTSIVYEDAQGNFTRPCGGPFLSKVTIGTDPVLTVRAPVVEFYNAALDHYFVTQDTAEIAALDNGVHAGWARTGESFLAFPAGKSDNLARPVCRYYGLPVPGSSTHFYSASRAECLQIAQGPDAALWTLESDDVFEAGLPDYDSGACTIGEAPLYRLWNGRADSNHRYTTSESTREQMVAQGWISEGFGPLGVAMCVPVR